MALETPYDFRSLGTCMNSFEGVGIGHITNSKGIFQPLFKLGIGEQGTEPLLTKK